MRRAIDFAWRVHGAQASWAGSADVKASILLALEGGALYALMAALSDGGFLAVLSGWLRPVAEAAAIFTLLLAIGAAVIAVFPRLGRGTPAGNRQQVIYFGDVRGWTSEELGSHLAALTEREELDLLSQQLTEMSVRNWVKHRWVQASLALLLAALAEIAAFVLLALQLNS